MKRMGLLVLLSLAGALLMYFYGLASLGEAFVPWKSLGKPPDTAIKVITPGYVQTVSGDIYRHLYNTDCSNNDCWVQSESPALDTESLLPVDRCGSLPALDNFIDSKAVCEFQGLAGYSLTIEAIDNKGFVYSWNYASGGEWSGAIPWFSAIIGAAAGLLLGLIILIALLFSDLIRWLEKRARDKDASLRG